MKKLLDLIVMASSVVSAVANGNEFQGKVVEVIDGNTLKVISTENETYKIVLLGIDCPELGQKYGDQAKKCLEKLALKKDVIVQLHGKDRWGNYIGVITTKENLDPRFQLLEEGLAWTSEKESQADLESTRTVAKEKGKGIWKEKSPTPPWEYRKQQSMTQPKQSS
jgi:endonuclease YncB( thermonuclease family)